MSLIDYLRGMSHNDVLFGLGAIGLLALGIDNAALRGRFNKLLKDLNDRGVL